MRRREKKRESRRQEGRTVKGKRQKKLHRVKRIGKERCKRKMEETIESTQEVEQMVSRGTQETIPSLLRK